MFEFLRDRVLPVADLRARLAAQAEHIRLLREENAIQAAIITATRLQLAASRAAHEEALRQARELESAVDAAFEELHTANRCRRLADGLAWPERPRISKN